MIAYNGWRCKHLFVMTIKRLLMDVCDGNNEVKLGGFKSGPAATLEEY